MTKTYSLALLLLAACEPTSLPDESLATASAGLARSASPPGGLSAGQVPQFVAVSFDDNFSSEGMAWATGYFAGKTNPAGTGNALTFDGTAARTTFFHNSTYLAGNETAWRSAFDAGHEAGDHTVNHPFGLGFDASQWTPEVVNCKNQLAAGLLTSVASIGGFRTPYLAYNDALFDVLVGQGFAYDTSIQSCWATGEQPGGCPWPYTLDAGSADAATVVAKFGSDKARPVNGHAGFWEVPVAALVVPPDSLAGTYGFPVGLRGRVATAIAGKGAPSFYEASTGKIAGLDITLIVDASMTKAEALATLKYSFDLHYAGNRAPFSFIAHTHVYASGYGAAANVPNAADRRAILSEFIDYTLTRPGVRVRPVRDVLAWVKSPVPLGSSCTPSCGGKVCGGDGCGGSCGSCAGGQTCNASGQCVSSCIPSCSGKVCGGDGCGGACGTCNVGQTCNASGQCVTSTGPCGAAAWTSGGGYTSGSVVTATCTASTVGTACYNQLGVKYAWSCGNAGWCPSLEPGSNMGGWWSAWSSLGSCP